MRRLTVLLAALGALLLVSATPAFAEEELPAHSFLETFGSSAQPGFAAPEGLAVDQSSGRVLAIDKGGNNEKQAVRFSTSPAWVEGDTFKIEGLNSSKCSPTVTGSITYSSTTGTLRTNVKNALGAVCGGTANFVTSGNSSSGLTFEFVGALAGESQPLASCASVTVTNPGATCSVERFAAPHKSGVYRYSSTGSAANFTSGNVLDEGASFRGAEKVQVAVDNSGGATNGNIYIVRGGVAPVEIFSSTGTALGTLTESSEGGFGEACGVAVDPSGNVYVGDNFGEVHKYAPSGSFPVDADNTANFPAPAPCALAAGAGPTAGSLFVAENVVETSGGSKVAKLNATSGAEEGSFELPVTTLSVDPGSGHVYVAGTHIAELAGFPAVIELKWTGASPSEVSLTPLIGSTPTAFGVAVNGTSGNLYTAKRNGPNLQVWSPLPPPGPALTLNVEEGEGTVVSNPKGLTCSKAAPGSCTTEVIAAGTKVVLTASPAPGYLVKSWKGCDAGGVNGRQCTVTLSSARTVGVKYYKVFSLEGSKSGGLGIMGTAPGGINCGYACSSSTALYKEGGLTVKAKPAKNFHFVEFTGGTGSAESCNGVTSPECTIASFSSNSAIEEVYAEDAKNTLTLTKEGGGQGFVKTKPTNINCGLTCTAAKATFYAAETPEVSVTLGKGTTSVTWESGAGTCTGNALTCTVPMNESHSLVAKFN